MGRISLRTLHRTSALAIGAFATVHLLNHLVSLASVPAHLQFMAAARKVYRQPAIEALLLVCVAFQIGSGLRLVARGWRRRSGAVARLQAASGAALALFLVIHVGAVLFGRIVLGFDTNFYFAAAGMRVAGYRTFFAPYYFLAVLALFAHMGCAAYRQSGHVSPAARRWALGLQLLAGLVVATLLVLSLAGELRTFDVPSQYLATYVKARP